jgi:hypothetical protein
MIVSRLIGGLGNQMFQYALAKKIALNHDTEVAFDLFLLLDRSSQDTNSVFREFELGVFEIESNIISLEESYVFNGKPSDSIFGKVKNRVSKVFKPLPLVIEKDRGFHPEILKTKNNHCLVGSFQSPHYFADIRTDLLNDFTLKKEFENEDSPYSKLIDDAEVSISVHFRRGDYIDNEYYNEILGELPMTFYEEALNCMVDSYPTANYFLFSDDIEWVKENVTIFPRCTFVENEKSRKGAITDLIQMSKCDHQIISHSTFAWWGGWLNTNNNKKVLAPRRWVSEKYIGDKTIHAVDIIPKDWREL